MSARRDQLTAFGLFVFTVLALLATNDDLGYVRDEGYYFRAARAYQVWFTLLFSEPGRALGAEAIEKHWAYNREHPVLIKVLFGFSERLFHQGLGWLRETTAWRLPGMLFGGLAVALTFLIGRRLFGFAVGLGAALLFLVTPRTFAHAHFAAFDMPVTAMMLAVLWAWLRTRDDPGWRPAILCGVIFGLAIATKHNALFLGPLLAAHEIVARLRARQPLWSPPPRALIAMALLGPLVFFLHWPLLWHHPLKHLGAYIQFHMQHAHYTVTYFGDLLRRPPFPVSFPFGMTAATQEPTWLLLVIAGLIALRRHAAAPVVWLQAAWPMLLIALPTVPVFGGVKHWLPSMPWLCLAAAFALSRCVEAFERRRALLWAAGLSLALLPAVIGLVRTWPYPLAYYSSTVGGVRGAADLMLQRNYWGYVGSEFFPRVASEMRRGERLFTQNMNGDCVDAYRRDGVLPRWVRQARNAPQARFMMHHIQHKWIDRELVVRRDLGSHTLADGVYLGEVPLVFLYERPRR